MIDGASSSIHLFVSINYSWCLSLRIEEKEEENQMPTTTVGDEFLQASSWNISTTQDTLVDWFLLVVGVRRRSTSSRMNADSASWTSRTSVPLRIRSRVCSDRYGRAGNVIILEN